MAEIKEILAWEYFSLKYTTTSNLGTKLSRAEIEQVLTENNVSLPLENSVEFFIVDKKDHRFRVLYAKDSDKFSFIKYKNSD